MGTTDSQKLAWMEGFSGGINSSPATYMLSQADADNLAFVVGNFATALAAAQLKGTRNAAEVAVKNAARDTAEQLCRSIAVQIKYNLGITDADKIAIGVRPVNHSRTPSPAPDSSPLLNIIGATPGAQTLRYADSFTPDRAAKPPGCSALLLYLHVGTEAVEEPTDVQLVGGFTRNPIGVPFAPEDDGKVATYFARWSSPRSEMGPWSLGVSMRIAA